MTSHDSVLTPPVKVEADIPEEQPKPHPQCHSKKLRDSAEMLDAMTSHDSVLTPPVKVEADIPEEQPELHPQCHSKKLCDSAEMLGVKTEPEVDIPAEKPQPHSWCDCEEAKKFPDQVQMSEVKIEVDVAEEPPASWMTGDLVQRSTVMEPDDATNDSVSHLAASLSSSAEMMEEDFNSSEEPLILKKVSGFSSSHEEPLILKKVSGFSSSHEEPLILKKVSGFSSSHEEPLILQKVPEFSSSDEETLGFNSCGDEPPDVKVGPSVDNDSTLKDPIFLPSDEADEESGGSSSSCDEPQSKTKRARKCRKRKTRHPQMQQAKVASLEIHQMQQRDLQTHQNRLDDLLRADGFHRQGVAAGGNCFFEASVEQLEAITPLELRNCLCNHLEDNFGTYIEFMVSHIEEDENERYLRFFVNLEELRRPGKWSDDAAGLLPQVLADWSERAVQIYSSDPFTPVIEILPTGGTSSGDPIVLSFYSHDPTQYDACRALSRPNKVKVKSADSKDDHMGDHKCWEKSSRDPIADGAAPSSPPTDNAIPNTPRAEDAVMITPRKQGSFTTPKTTLVRKQKAMPETWKKNVRKSMHLQGKEYVSQTGKVVPAKRMKPVACSKSQCRFKCSESIPEDKRRELFEAFYSLGSCKRQKEFVCANVQQRKTVTYLNEDNQPAQKKRQICRVFTFNVEGTLHRVCKNFFLATLAMGGSYVSHAIQNSSSGVYTITERRGRARPHNKTSEVALERVKEHIASFPVAESHFARKDSQRLFLSSSLTAKKMYELYQEQCQQLGHQPVSQRKYRQVLSEDFNYSFHTPKKDQCATCLIQESKQRQGTASEEDKQAFQDHVNGNNRDREEKDRDKAEARKDLSKRVVTVDLQAMLQAPCGVGSQLYYKRKLSMYHFIIYSLSDKKGTCFTWDETEGKRGSCEIATCLSVYLSSLPKSVEEVTIFSDCWAGQNRSQFLAAAMIHLVNNVGKIKVVTLKYLETGHTLMECDRLHAAITFAKKHTPVYTPSGWDIILRMASRGRPYVVIPLKHTDVLDFKSLASSAIRNAKTDVNGRRVDWRDIKCLQLVRGPEEVVYVKSSFDQGHFQVLRFSQQGCAAPLKTVPHCYSSRLPVSRAKKQDLVSLCASGIIPEEHHAFYKALPTSSSAADKLPEPNITESDEDSE